MGNCPSPIVGSCYSGDRVVLVGSSSGEELS